MYTHADVHTHTHTHARTYIHTHAHTYTCTHIHTRTHARTHTHTVTCNIRQYTYIPSMHNGLSIYLDTTIGSSVGIWLGYKMSTH